MDLCICKSSFSTLVQQMSVDLSDLRIWNNAKDFTMTPETWGVEILMFFRTHFFLPFFLTSTHCVSLQISHLSLECLTKHTVRYVCGIWLTPGKTDVCLETDAGRVLLLGKVRYWKYFRKVKTSSPLSSKKVLSSYFSMTVFNDRRFL